MFALVGISLSWTSRVLSYWCLNVNVSWVSVPTWWKPEEQVHGVDWKWIVFGFWILYFLDSEMVQLGFSTFLAQHLEALEFENMPLLPCLFRHRTRQVELCSHVDDLCGERPDLLWLMEEMKQFTVSGGEVFPAHQTKSP